MKFEKVHDDYHDRQVAALTPDYDLVPAHLQYGIREILRQEATGPREISWPAYLDGAGDRR